MKRVSGTGQHVRHHVRPVVRDEIRLWYPKYQEWLTLDEYSYILITKSVRRQSLDVREGEDCCTGATERLRQD
jgi:hypothetical protein